MDEHTRRTFLKRAGASVLGLGCVGGVANALGRNATAEKPAEQLAAKRWAMVIDTTKCGGDPNCRACSNACHQIHNVPDIPDQRREVKWIWREPYEHVFPDEAHGHSPPSLLGRPTTVLCNHCDNPPCVRVCPTQATWKRGDGLVMMDMHRCIGCRYCVVACPYGSRSFNWTDPRPHIQNMDKGFPTRTKGVVEKCNLCAERLAQGLRPACVEACKKGALLFGDLGDPRSEVARKVREVRTIRRKPALGTEPYVFYVV